MQKVVLIIVLVLCGCHSVIVPEDFAYEEIKTNHFILASWQKITDASAPVKFYIEGDGAAFNAYGKPTKNPTPKGKMIRELAFGDMGPNVVYLARPCQYVKDDMCEQKYWTTARFAPEVIDSSYEAIKKIVGDRSVVLVGFSGGAQVAGLVSVLNEDLKVKKLITIAGNLNHEEWTSYHHVPALSNSLSLADYRNKYLRFSQVHYAGKEDNIMPKNLIADFTNGHNLIIVEEASHGKGWEKVYPLIWKE